MRYVNYGNPSLLHRQRIGLLGGSFNPAHVGHVHVSVQAIKRLRLDAVWWLVSPQNPLKSTEGMADYRDRLASAQAMVASSSQIHIAEIEQETGTQTTVELLRYITARPVRPDFVWLMGADNLAGFHHWYRWKEIMRLMPLAVCDRAPFSLSALRSPAAMAMAPYRVQAHQLAGLVGRAAPAWGYVHMPRHAASATQIRNLLGEAAFLRHN